ncbi:MAG: hypothetical protein O7E57_05245 [Gammaproteobacteria bacterium]|nr:hypothetical protein [Gammaproteobacteria bacterium]
MTANIVRLEIADNNRTKDRLGISESGLRTINGEFCQSGREKECAQQGGWEFARVRASR